MKKIFIFILVFSFTVMGKGYCFLSGDDTGTAGGQFLKLGIGGRAVAMGGTGAASAKDETAIYWNPAALNYSEKISAGFMHVIWFEDIFYDWFGFSYNKGENIFGGSIQYLSYGDLTETDASGAEGETFSPSDIALTLSGARMFGIFPVGLNVKFIQSKIKEQAFAAAADIGMIWPAADRLDLALAVSNAGMGLKYESKTDPLPLNVKIGAAYNVDKNILITTDLNLPVYSSFYAGVGGEYKFHIKENVNASIRAGYNTRTKDTGGVNGITAGAGMNYGKYTVDYALMFLGELNNTHRISLALRY